MEEAEGLESGSTGADAAGASGVDPVAVALALGGASREEADAFLKRHGALIDDQRHHLHEQTKLARLQAQELSHELGLRHWSLWVRHASSLLKLALELSAGVLLLALVVGISVMVWTAAHSEGLIVESFAVPPELAQKGLSGQVIAGQLTDRLTAMQAATRSVRAARSYSNNWGDDDIKVEIPETGVSVGEAYRFLKSWLGHETHVGGEVWKTDSGIAIAARVSGGSSTFTGAASDLDALIQKTAEDIFSRTQPYRYATFLAVHGRRQQALDLYKALALTGPASERGWGYIGWSNLAVDSSSPQERERLLRLAVQNGLTVALSNLAVLEGNLGRTEQALALVRQVREALRSDSSLAPAQIPGLTRSSDAVIASYLGDDRAATQAMKDSIATGLSGNGSPSFALAGYQISDHDLAAARTSLENPLPSSGISPANDRIGRVNLNAQMAMAVEDWTATQAADQKVIALMLNLPSRLAARRTTANGDPRAAVIAAHLGRFAEAEALLRPMPADCYQCLRARAQVAEMEGQHARADWWFARAVASNPSIPLAETEWGQALLKRGQPDAAITKFKLSSQKGPHFADPLEGWGEALMAKNQSHLALAKFEVADKYAPNWGRLHLKWGEALMYTGKRDEAQKQYALAAGLDLSEADKAELARVSAHG